MRTGGNTGVIHQTVDKSLHPLHLSQESKICYPPGIVEKREGVLMPLTGYLKIEEIPGESQRVDHEDEIDIHDIKWGIERSTSTILGRGRVTARSEMKPLTVYKYYDASSPYLARAVHRGQSFPKVVLSVRKDSGESHLDYLVITMENVVLTAYDVASNREHMADFLLEERVDIEFESVTVKYTVQEADHSAGDEHEVELSI